MSAADIRSHYFEGSHVSVDVPTEAHFGRYFDSGLQGTAIIYTAANGDSIALVCIVARSATSEDAAAAVVQGAAHVAGELLYSASQIGGDDAADE